MLYSIFWNYPIKIYYLQKQQIKLFEISYKKIPKNKNSINLFLNENGFFDTIYPISYIKNAAFCQNIIFNVFFHTIKNYKDY